MGMLYELDEVEKGSMTPMTVDPADAVVRGDRLFEKRWAEWTADMPSEVDQREVLNAKAVARQWWHMGLVRGVAMMVRGDNNA